MWWVCSKEARDQGLWWVCFKEARDQAHGRSALRKRVIRAHGRLAVKEVFLKCLLSSEHQTGDGLTQHKCANVLTCGLDRLTISEAIKPPEAGTRA